MPVPPMALTPTESVAYPHLFSLADKDSIGVVVGDQAVQFFKSSNLPPHTLGEIWQIADSDNEGL